MKKIEMMNRMATKIDQLEFIADHYREEIENLYLRATGEEANDEPNSILVKRTLDTFKQSGTYNSDTMYDIEYMALFYKVEHAKAFEMRRMFEELFGKTIYDYRYEASQA